MCYSAQLWSNYKKYLREFRAEVTISAFKDLFFRRSTGARLLIPRGVELAFANPQTEEEREVWKFILAYRDVEATTLQQELFSQRTRLNDAQRKLDAKPDKPTKAALESKRIATNKIERALEKLADLNRADPIESDSRIFPKSYVPVMTMVDGELVVRPMRYQCRPARAPVNYDELYPGTFNARRDSLEKFWRGEWCHTHGVVVAQAFYENVLLHKAEGRELRPDEQESNTIIQFRPDTGQDMLVACIWSEWKGQAGSDTDLLSFAFITDEPPPEVSAAGHDRCIIPLRRENLMSWLNPDITDMDVQFAILDDRERPYYQHALKAA